MQLYMYAKQNNINTNIGHVYYCDKIDEKANTSMPQHMWPKKMQNKQIYQMNTKI